MRQQIHLLIHNLLLETCYFFLALGVSGQILHLDHAAVETHEERAKLEQFLCLFLAESTHRFGQRRIEVEAAYMGAAVQKTPINLTIVCYVVQVEQTSATPSVKHVVADKIELLLLSVKCVQLFLGHFLLFENQVEVLDEDVEHVTTLLLVFKVDREALMFIG